MVWKRLKKRGNTIVVREDHNSKDDHDSIVKKIKNSWNYYPDKGWRLGQ